MTATRIIGVPLILSAVLLGVGMAAAEHGQMLGAGIASMAAVGSAFVAGVFVGELT